MGAPVQKATYRPTLLLVLARGGGSGLCVHTIADRHAPSNLRSPAREGEKHLTGVHGGCAGSVFWDWGGHQEQEQQRYHDSITARFQVCREHRPGHQQLAVHHLWPGRKHRFGAPDGARAVLPSARTR